MNSSALTGKKVLIAPCNLPSTRFASYLQESHQTAIEGFLDKNQKNDLCRAYTEASAYQCDAIVILSPNYAQEILKTLLKLGHKREKIYFALEKLGSMEFTLYKSFWHYLLMTKVRPQIKRLKSVYSMSYFKLMGCKNKHRDKRAFIVANGPSLQIEDLAKLQNEITFACNKIYLAFDETQWRPTYYFVTDGLVYTQNYKKIENLKLNKFFSTHMLSLAKKMKNATYFPLSYKQPAKFGTDALSGFYSGSTVTYVMLEFAIYMGIKEIYIIGLDFNFELPQKIDFKELSCEGEANHFHKEYRHIGEKWTKPDMEHQKHSFLEAKKFCDAHGIKIYNASRESELDVFERISFESLF